MDEELSHKVLLDRLRESEGELRAKEGELRAKADGRQALRDELAAILEKYLPIHEQYLEIVARVEAELGDGGQRSGSAGSSSPAPRRGGIPRSPDLSGLDVDFTGAKNLKERVLRIALAMEGKEMNVSSVTRFLINAGQYNTTVKNFRSNVNRVFTEQPDIYHSTGPGNFIYVG